MHHTCKNFLSVVYFGTERDIDNKVIGENRSMEQRLENEVKRTLFVYNPRAGKGTVVKSLHEIVDAFTKANYPVMVYPTQAQGDACRLVESRDAGQYDLIVCSGGDGTLREVVNGLIKSGVTTTVGYIPAGSTNDFARSLGLSDNIPEAMEIITRGKPFLCDAGNFNGENFVYVAAFGVVQKVGSIFMQVTIGLSQGIMPLLGYCYGAGDFQRVKEINKWAFGITACFVVTSILLVELFPEALIGIFTGEAQVIAAGTDFLKRWILCTLGMCFTSLFSSIFQAMGKWKESLALSVIRQAFLIIPLLILLNRLMGAYGLVWSQPIADTISFLVGTGLYRSIVIRETND